MQVRILHRQNLFVLGHCIFVLPEMPIILENFTKKNISAMMTALSKMKIFAGQIV